MKKRIFYYDTDCGGVVYYANYLKYLEEARTEYFETKGFNIKKLAEKGTMFVVARQEIDYKFPACYGDVLEAKSWVEDISNVKIVFAGEVTNQEGKTICSAKTILVCVSKELKPQPMPQQLRKALQGDLGKTGA